MSKESRVNIKCYVLIVSEFFPKTHPRSGEETGFMQSIKDYSKLHTIRSNYELWKKRFVEIDKGNAYLSVRIWSGKPYRSKQHEIFRFDHTRGIGIEKLELNDFGWMAIGNNNVDVSVLAENDGLSESDFKEWFKGFSIGEEKVIIHFTDYRYYKEVKQLLPS